jgi:BirA family biotin operon repressor/biotin-[acetyl-CoA-carboxylase] ligase
MDYNLSMKEQILHILRLGERISGKDLGRRLGISRSMVWKYIRSLRGEGYLIDSYPGSGYLLVRTPESLLPEEIKAELKTDLFGRRIVYYRELSSTQDAAKALAAQGAAEGTVVIAELQAAGRGRIGRVWASPPGGIYLSLILRPEIKPADALCLLLIAGVAVAQAIEQLTGLKPRLKWPNDIIIADRKACGILAEMSAEIDRLNFIVIGIGVNVNTESFPDEIKGLATSLKLARGEEVSRLKLVCEILWQFESLYRVFQESGFETIRERWKDLSNTIGSWVSVISGGQQLEGAALDIDHDGALILKQADGILTRVIAGELVLGQAGSGPNESK